MLARMLMRAAAVFAAFAVLSFDAVAGTHLVECGGTNDTAAIQTAINNASNAGGFVVFEDDKACAVDSTLIVGSPFVTLGSLNHGGALDNGPIIKWIGSAGGIVLRIEAPAGAGNDSITGNGIHGLTIDCNNSAAIGLQIVGAKRGRYENLLLRECTEAALDAVPQAPIADNEGVSENLFQQIHTRSTGYGVGVRLRGNSTELVNTHNNVFIDVRGVHKYGTFMELQNADSNSFYQISANLLSGGTGKGLVLTGNATHSARSNVFVASQFGDGGVELHGTASGVTPVHDNIFIGVPTTNGAQLSHWARDADVQQPYIQLDTGISTGNSMINGCFAHSPFSMQQCLAAKNSNASVYVYNGTQDGITLDNGAGKWTLRQDSSNNFAPRRLAGTGSFKLSGFPVEINGATQFPRTFAVTYGTGTIGAGAQQCDSLTVTGIKTSGGAVTANGAVDPSAGCVLASVRASANNTVRMCWQNTNASNGCSVSNSTWTFTQAQ